MAEFTTATDWRELRNFTLKLVLWAYVVPLLLIWCLTSCDGRTTAQRFSDGDQQVRVSAITMKRIGEPCVVVVYVGDEYAFKTWDMRCDWGLADRVKTNRNIPGLMQQQFR